MTENNGDELPEPAGERRQAAKSRRSAEDLVQAIFDHALDGIALVSVPTRELALANPAFLRMTGYTRHELPALRLDNLYRPEDLPGIVRHFEELAAGNISLLEKIIVRRRDGSLFYADMNGSSLPLNGRRYVLCEFRDITDRLAAQQALREQEERHHRIYDSLREAFAMVDMTGRIVDCNLAFQEMLGYSAEELKCKTYRDLTPAKWHDFEQKILAEQVIRDGQSQLYEKEYIHRDGKIFPVELKAVLLRDKDNQPEAMWAMIRDLTERRQTERRLTVALENSPVAIFEQDADLRYKWAFNPILGYAAGDIMGKTDADILEPESADRLTALKQSVMAAGEPAQREVAVSRPGGPVEYYDLHVEPQLDAGGQVTGLIGAAINITKQTEQQKELSKALAQRQWAEAVLREREEQLALFVDYAPASIAMFDRRMRYLAASRRWIHDHGIDRPDIRGYRHYDLVPDIPKKWRDVHSRCLAGAVEHCDEDMFVGADGLERWVRWEVRPWRLPGGEIGGIIIFSEDITEVTQKRKELAKATAETAQANAAKSQFLAAASHDLRQPLHALDLYVGIIADRLPADCADIVARMKECSTNLSDLLNELLDLSRLDAGAVHPQMQDFSLAEFLDRVASTHAPSAEQKNLLFRVARTRLTGRTDPQLLQQLVANLVSNAIRYTERGSILIGIRRREGRLWIEVWDTGIGIPADKQRVIFEPFKQLGNPERNRKGGTGLGLALVHRLAELLGLRIRVSSRVGRGSLFAVEVPRGRASDAGCATDDHHPGQQTPRLRVALVEDDPLVREATEHGLTHLGHEVIGAADTAALLAGLDEAPDMVIADYRLAGNTTGQDAIAAVRQRYGQGIPAIVITGDTDPGVVQGIRESGLRVINKPLQLKQLQACLDEIGSSRPPTGHSGKAR